MFFCRQGNKNKYADRIISLFPPHITYIEPFFGLGGIFFNKPLAKYNLVNDNDLFIYNLWTQLKTKEDVNKLIEDINKLPIYQSILDEEDSVESNILLTVVSMYGGGGATRTKLVGDSKAFLEKNILEFREKFFNKLEKVIIHKMDCFKYLRSLDVRGPQELEATFIYCDPPYINNLGDVKANRGWNRESLINLIDALNDLKPCKYAISEYDSPQVLEIAKEKGLKVNIIRESYLNQTTLTKKTEILLTNYDITEQQLSLFK
jgi:DNA adenine methylase